MDEIIAIAWAVLGIVLIIAEIFTLGFVLLWFGVGALAAGLLAYLGFGLGLQFLVFFATSILLTVSSRTIFEKYFASYRNDNALKSGFDALPGKIGVVVEASHGALNQAAVKSHGSTWTAFPVEGEAALQIGERVTIETIRGASIYVRRAVSELPAQRVSFLSEGEE